MTWRWLTGDAVSQFHADQLDRHGGGAGVRDPGRIDAALARPPMIAAYEPEADVARLAAAYAHGIAKGHPFVDGNKRTAWVAARTFLILNGYRLTASMDDRYERMLALAAGTMTEDTFAEWLRAHLAPLQD